MPAEQEKDRLTVHVKIAARAKALDSKQMPVMTEQTIQIALKAMEVEKGRTDPLALFQFPGRMELSPGKYDWKVVVRDERAGKVGSYESVIDVPDFGGSVSPSSIVFLMHEKKPLAQPPFRKYDAVPSAEQKSLSYVAYLDTGELAPGEYNLIVALPGSETGISRRFTVVKR
jgi:hypothetical protein